MGLSAHLPAGHSASGSIRTRAYAASEGAGPAAGALWAAQARIRLSPPPVRVVVGVTTEDDVNLRDGPGTKYEVIARLPRGTQLEVISKQDGWYRVATARGTVAWIVEDYIEVRPAGSTSERSDTGAVSATIIDEGVNLRAGPGTSYEIYGKFGADVQVEVLGYEQSGGGSWYKVRSPRGTTGWVAAEYAVLDAMAEHLFPEAGEAPATNAESPNMDAARLAQRFEGAPYLWGGASPRGFDCSGFTLYVYRQLGVYLPRKASQQYSARYGERIGPIGELLPGDLVFFERTTSEPGITHAGIYAGGGRMIAARSERLGVRYVSLYEPFWNSRYVGGLRPDR